MNSHPVRYVKKNGVSNVIPTILNANALVQTGRMSGSTKKERMDCGQDYEWLIAIARLYDEGWPTLKHYHEGKRGIGYAE